MLLGVKVHRRNLESTSGDVWTNQLFIAENAKQESVCPSKMCLDEAVDVARASGIQRGAEKHPSNHSDLCLVSIVDIQYSTERLDLLDGGNRANHKRKHLWSPKTSQFRVLFVQQQMETCGTRDHKDKAVWPEWPRCSMQQVRSMK